jgi:hypothetical protein
MALKGGVRFASEFAAICERPDREDFIRSVAKTLTTDNQLGDRAVLVLNALICALAQQGHPAALGVLAAIQDYEG